MKKSRQAQNLAISKKSTTFVLSLQNLMKIIMRWVGFVLEYQLNQIKIVDFLLIAKFWDRELFSKNILFLVDTYPSQGILERGLHFPPICNPFPFETLQYGQALTEKE